MNNNIFIVTPITDIMESAVMATSGIGCGIETYPLYDYVMQSLFLKCTGFLEQKMKCIAWEMATFNYEYRYSLLQHQFGECSTLEDKNKIYKKMKEEIKRIDSGFSINISEKSEIASHAHDDIVGIFSNTALSVWMHKEFVLFCNEPLFDEQNFMKDDLLCGNLAQIYKEGIYPQRNRLAHNTLCYQQNLPMLKSLRDAKDSYRNYFLWFSILELIDLIFIVLYKKYHYALDNNVF